MTFHLSTCLLHLILLGLIILITGLLSEEFKLFTIHYNALENGYETKLYTESVLNSFWQTTPQGCGKHGFTEISLQTSCKDLYIHTIHIFIIRSTLFLLIEARVD
jgi:hypothetical protein